MHVALGWSYREKRVQRGSIVYCALEGGGGFSSRVEAWRQRHLPDFIHKGDGISFLITQAQRVELHRRGYSEADIHEMTPAQAHEVLSPVSGYDGEIPFYLLDVPLDLIAEQMVLIAAIREQVAEQRPAAIFIDTLNRALVGDENASQDMAKFIRAADMIRIEFNCLVVLIHHCGVIGTRPRGHTSLAAADDAQIAVVRDEKGIIVAKVEWMKDGDACGPMACTLERVGLGCDDDGDEMSSCIVVPATLPAKAMAGPKLSATNQLGFAALQELTSSEGQKPPPEAGHLNLGATTKIISIVAWRERFYEIYPVSGRTAKQKAFVRVQLKLMELKLIETWGTYVWISKQSDKTDKAGQLDFSG
jgi:hypothetical protein